MFRYSDVFVLTGEFIRDSIEDDINYKKAQITLWKYHRKDNFCTANGVADPKTLEALVIISEHQEVQKNKRGMLIRIKNQSKTAL